MKSLISKLEMPEVLWSNKLKFFVQLQDLELYPSINLVIITSFDLFVIFLTLFTSLVEMKATWRPCLNL